MGLFSFVVSWVHTVAGFAAFITFLVLRFYAAAVFGIVSATISAATGQLTWLHMNRRVRVWYEHTELNQFFWLGFWTLAFGTSGFIYHLVALIVLEELQLKLLVTLIWGFIMAQSGGILMYTSHKYWQESFDTFDAPSDESD